MDKLQIFNHPLFGELPVIIIDDEEWFGATEAAKALSFSDPHKAITNHIEEDDSTIHPVIDSLGRTQNKKFTNESGLYNLIFGAAKQGNNLEIKTKAKDFKRWVTSEVLPSIRKFGSYSKNKESIDIAQLTPELQMFKQIWDGLAKAHIDANETKALLESTNKEVSAVKTTLTVIQDTIVTRDDNWRESINKMLNGAAFRSGGNYRDLRTESYRLLEERAHCDLNRRLRNMKDRLEENGATKTKIAELSKMDVIEMDAKVKEIYTSIVKEISIGSLKIAK